ncbi:MAG TPA: hypothetical protein VKT70_14425 [Stellaceae bacterium]|nr:hypothetical protein [Stellaceae bacterium]
MTRIIAAIGLLVMTLMLGACAQNGEGPDPYPVVDINSLRLGAGGGGGM